MCKIKNLTIDKIRAFKNEACPDGCVRIEWSANIGRGQYDLVFDGEKIYAYSENMDHNSDKDFIRTLLNMVIDEIVVEE